MQEDEEEEVGDEDDEEDDEEEGEGVLFQGPIHHDQSACTKVTRPHQGDTPPRHRDKAATVPSSGHAAEAWGQITRNKPVLPASWGQSRQCPLKGTRR